MAISDKTRKLLWVRSGNRCAICKTELILEATCKDEEAIVGDECHIISKRQGGPRYDDTPSSKNLDDYSNCILLCKTHHKMVDDQENTYTVSRLQEIKKAHEKWVSEILSFSYRLAQPTHTQQRNSNKDSNKGRFLLRLSSGGEVLNVILGAHALDFGHDEIKTEYDLEIIKEFSRLVEDSDILSESEVSNRIQFEYDLKKSFEHLEENGFWIFGKREKRKHKIKGKIVEFEWAVLRVLYTTNPVITKLSIKETYPGTVPGETAPPKDMREILYRGSRDYYGSLRGPNGRFRYLRISDIILPGTRSPWLETHVEVETAPPGPGTSSRGARSGPGQTIPAALAGLWPQPVKHAVIVGDGGMGKTVSLLHWWEKLLDDYGPGQPIPVFIALNELNQVPEGKREDFILSRIAANYTENSLTPDQVKKVMNTPGPGEKNGLPALVLLLDGFNEITVDKRELLLELNRLTEQCRGLQVVLTSRYDMRGNFNWGHWHLLRLEKLEENQVEKYLSRLGLVPPGPGRLRELMGNPMMLTLYAAAGQVKQDYPGPVHCRFKDRVETPGELLWNFMEAQVALLPERLAHDEKKIVCYQFLLQFFLPGLGYEMEKAGLFDFSYQQLEEVMEKLCRRFERDDFFNTHPRFNEFAGELPVGKSADSMARRQRAARLQKILVEELFMLVKEEDSFRFLHQHFRDFFAAAHILNELDMGKSRGDTTVLRERRLDFQIRRLMGELEGEHRARPYLKDKKWRVDINKENRLYKALESMRGEFGTGVGYGVWNIVEIWKEVRGELSGADLSCLDLSGVMLNGIRCSRFYPGGYLAANFDGARVGARNLFFGGHSHFVKSALYSRDGKKILSASQDNTIKEWVAATGECVRTLAGNSSEVLSVVYSRDGKKILSSSYDLTIKEWDAATGECLQTWKEGEKPVPCEYRSGDNEDIELETDDNKIKFKGKELVNIPGLFIQGCSFKDLEKGSEISPENLKILKQYGGRFKITQKFANMKLAIRSWLLALRLRRPSGK
ncbi:MAG: HNH endonuclease [Candidatus Aminicenantes bacterium]|nr:MAG: HNH endonuclease [Candidatus Aminicenantes bacterium]